MDPIHLEGGDDFDQNGIEKHWQNRSRTNSAISIRPQRARVDKPPTSRDKEHVSELKAGCRPARLIAVWGSRNARSYGALEPRTWAAVRMNHALGRWSTRLLQQVSERRVFGEGVRHSEPDKVYPLSHSFFPPWERSLGQHHMGLDALRNSLCGLPAMCPRI